MKEEWPASSMRQHSLYSLNNGRLLLQILLFLRDRLSPPSFTLEIGLDVALFYRLFPFVS